MSRRLPMPSEPVSGDHGSVTFTFPAPSGSLRAAIALACSRMASPAFTRYVCRIRYCVVSPFSIIAAAVLFFVESALIAGDLPALDGGPGFLPHRFIVGIQRVMGEVHLYAG